MAAFSSIALGIGTAASLAVSANSIVQGNKNANQGQADLDAYQRQEFTNVADNLKVRTEAQDFQAQAIDRSLASQLDFLRQGGSYTNATSITNQAINAKQQIASTIQTQRNRIDEIRSQDDSRIRDLNEARENSDIAGLGAQIQYGNQQKQQGIAGIGSALSTLGTAFASGEGSNKLSTAQKQGRRGEKQYDRKLKVERGDGSLFGDALRFANPFSRN